MNNFTLADVTFSQHILERYVERTMKKTGNEMKQYLAQNELQVKEKLLMLYNSAELLWSGKVKEHNFTHFYINKDGWIIVVDKEGKVLITVYKADLELDSEFNKMYVEKVKQKINEFNNSLNEKNIEITTKKDENNETIDKLQARNTDLKDEIDYNNMTIKSLEQDNDLMQKEYDLLEKELHHKIEKFVNAKIF